MAPKSTQTKPRKKTRPKVNFGANSSSRKRRSSSDADGSDADASSTKRPRTNAASGSTRAGTSTSTGRDEPSANTSGNGTTSAGASTNDAAGETTSAQKRVRNRWGIGPKEVPKEARTTQTAFQRFIRGLCGLLTQADVLPSAVEKRKHYDRRFDNVDDYREHMRTLVNESRTAVSAAKDLATTLIRDAKAISSLIANDVARIPENHLATVFTMILKAGLQGFCPDLEGPVQSTYNQLHRHLAVSGFQFLASSWALCALEVNVNVAANTELLCDIYDHFTYGTLAQKTRMERRRPGSLSQSLTHGAEFKARARLRDVRFKAASRLELRKPVQRMACVQEAHSDDEHSSGRVREKPGRNPVVGKFFRTELDPAAEAYRKRNAKSGQREPKARIRGNPLLPASDIGVILPPDVPVDFFTPEFFNALTLKERARYVKTGVAFPLKDFVFDEAHDDWKTMGKKEFMEKYGDDVLDQYDLPSAEEIDALPDSDAEDEEEEEINLEDTEDEEDDEEMEVDDELRDD